MSRPGNIIMLIRHWLGVPAREQKQALSLRDYFAARALAGMLGNNRLKAPLGPPSLEECPQIASICYSLADAMIVARAREGDGK